MTGATVAVVTVLVAVAHVGVIRRHRDFARAAKEEAAKMVIQLTAAGLLAPVVAGDHRAIEAQLGLLRFNEDVRSAAVWGANIEMPSRPAKRLGLYVRSTDGIVAQQTRSLASEMAKVQIPDLIPDEIDQSFNEALVSTAPIIDRARNTVGVVRIVFSLERERAAEKLGEREAIIFSIANATLLATLLLLFARSTIVGPLQKLSQAANRLESGEKVTIDVNAEDEIGDLAAALRSMSSAVEIREAQLKHRNRDMRLILDNAGEGFITVSRDGVMAHERSKMIETWFGTIKEEWTFFDFIQAVAGQETADWMMLGCQAIDDGFLPIQVAFDQLPKQFTHQGRFFALEYRPIVHEDGAFRAVLVVVRNVTAEVEYRRAEALQREGLALFQHYVRNRSGLFDFFREATDLIASITGGESDVPAMRRDIHTLKGNAALFGVDRIADYCHALEEKWSEEDRIPTPTELRELTVRWRSVEELISNLNPGSESEIVISREDHGRLLASIRRRQPYDELEAAFDALAYEPASRRLAVMRDQVMALCERYGKPRTKVVVKPTSIRLPSARWARFWPSLVHVFRNAVAHGLEEAEARVRQGKSPNGRITLSLERSGDEVVFAFEDDGRGIEWTKLAQRASELGLGSLSQKDLEQALFAGALSSEQSASELSGRGFGISAVNATVRALGGTVSIESATGRGTLIRCVFPSSLLLDSTAEVTRPAPASPSLSSPSPSPSPSVADSGLRREGQVS
ncbi:MAG: Hpt domain-containing protein [Deltaproteobacteria bacterium]|nr:Hpt domain-containing protein [Deltaproteobacteria bacterium]